MPSSAWHEGAECEERPDGYICSQRHARPGDEAPSAPDRSSILGIGVGRSMAAEKILVHHRIPEDALARLCGVAADGASRKAEIKEEKEVQNPRGTELDSTCLEPTTGLEPVTCRLRIGCSTN